jgi:hypothetical protein
MFFNLFLNIFLTLAALVRRHRLRERHREPLEEGCRGLSGSRHARNLIDWIELSAPFKLATVPVFDVPGFAVE